LLARVVSDLPELAPNALPRDALQARRDAAL